MTWVTVARLAGATGAAILGHFHGKWWYEQREHTKEPEAPSHVSSTLGTPITQPLILHSDKVV